MYPAKTRPSVRPLFLALSMFFAPPALADSIPELRTLLDGGDGPAAWAMASRMEPEHAGDPEFDFWYGLAAKSSGNHQQSVLALERVVILQPANLRAKLELGDSYYRLGNNPEARRLFEEVLATAPPDGVQERIRTYLDALGAAETRSKRRVSGYLGLAGGHDSNISSATNIINHNINLGGTLRMIELSPTSLKQGAGFAEVRGGADLVQVINQRTLGFIGVNAQRRDNADLFSAGNFDYSVLGVSGGWVQRRGTATWRLPLAVQGVWAETEGAGSENDDRYLFSAGLEYSRPLTSRTGMSGFIQGGNVHTPSDDSRNIWQMRAGAGYNWNASDLPLRLSGMAIIGTEPTERTDALARVNGRDFLAGRVSASWKLSDSQSLNGAFGVQGSRYHAPAFFSSWGTRRDTLLDASLGWQWQLDRDWTINADYSWAYNSSFGTNLYDYSRSQIKAGATWRF